MADEKDSPAEAPAEEAAVPEEAIPEGCNCKDKTRTKVCPVHSRHAASAAGTPFGEDVILVTDDDLNKEKPFSTYRGHIFDCPNCSKPSIMVNQNMGEFCVACGVRVRVESKVVTDYIRTLE